MTMEHGKGAQHNMSGSKTHLTIDEYNSIGREAAVQKPEVPDYPEIGVFELQNIVIENHKMIETLSGIMVLPEKFQKSKTAKELLTKYDLTLDELGGKLEALQKEQIGLKKTINELNERKMEINADMLKAKNEKADIYNEMIKNLNALENTGKLLEEHGKTEQNETQKEAGIEYYKARIDHLKGKIEELRDKYMAQEERIARDRKALRKLDHGKNH